MSNKGTIPQQPEGAIKLKLSELNDDQILSYYDAGCVYSATELKHEIMELNESHHLKEWFVVTMQTWLPDADSMISTYIENEAEGLYENADEHLNDAFTKERTERIQTILDEAFPSGLTYWEYGEKVEIDIFPPGEEPTQ